MCCSAGSAAPWASTDPLGHPSWVPAPSCLLGGCFLGAPPGLQGWCGAPTFQGCSPTCGGCGFELTRLSCAVLILPARRVPH